MGILISVYNLFYFIYGLPVQNHLNRMRTNRARSID
jgi:hypothetical protein